jgi:nanoRNase/pAp phosphatase (c-di-AMP/oligoRNAs hydrolase)
VTLTDRVDGEFDAAVVLECGSVARTELAGLERSFLINVDHHVGNTRYGAINWLDETAAACGEMVFDIVRGLGVPVTPAIATPLYVAILTDTGSFQHGNITARTFDVCGHIAAAGVSPATLAAAVYQQGSVGKLRLTGALLAGMELAAGGRVAVLHVDDGMLRQAGCAATDLEGLINLPLAAADVHAVLLFKDFEGELRVSARSKGSIDVRAVAVTYGGGGHRNAAGFSVQRPLAAARPRVVADVAADVVGPDVKFHHSKLNFKWAEGGEEVKWHQDIQFWPHTNYSPATIGTLLYDCGPDQGPLGGLPGSQNGPLYDLYNDDGTWNGALSDADAASLDLEQVEYMTGPAGSLTIHNCRTVHGSPPNQSDTGRPLLLYAYSSADAFTYTYNPIMSSYYGAIVRGHPARHAHHDPRPCQIPPDWSGGYTSIFAAQAGEDGSGDAPDARV